MNAFFRNRTFAVASAGMLIWTIAGVALTESASATKCAGVKVRAGSSIQRAINSHGTGTTFCLAPGTYRVRTAIRPKDRDKFVGTARHRGGVLVKTRSAEVIFELGGTSRVKFRHFSIKGARNACPGQICGETGRAISRGTRVTVSRMHIYRNGINAIGGTAGPLVIKYSEIDHNGARVSDGISAGVKSTDSLTVIHSNVHDNRGNGIWCDIQCGDFTVIGSKVTGNSASGIFDEISQGTAILHGNKIKGNNTIGDGFRGGLSITNSKNVIAYNNVFRRNKGFGIAARMDGRVNCGGPDAGCGYVVSNVLIKNNTLHGDSVEGCGLAGVRCSRNRGG